MTWPADTLAGVYLFLFAFGAIFSIASLLLGAFHGQGHLPDFGHAGHLDGGVGHGHLGHAHAGAHPTLEHAGGPGTGQSLSVGSDAPSPLNISTLMVFLTWFGAAGYILRVYYGAVAALSLFVAVFLGLLGAAAIYFFLAKVLWRGQTALDPAKYAITGTVARVTSPIRAGGTGEIVYALDGKRRVDGARSVDGAPLPLGADVAIVRYVDGLAYVCPLDEARDDYPFGSPPSFAGATHPPPAAADEGARTGSGPAG